MTNNVREASLEHRRPDASTRSIRTAGLVLFAAHLVVIGYLAYKSGYVPALLGVLVVISGLGYAFDSVGTMLTESRSRSAWSPSLVSSSSACGS